MPTLMKSNDDALIPLNQENVNKFLGNNIKYIHQLQLKYKISTQQDDLNKKNN